MTGFVHHTCPACGHRVSLTAAGVVDRLTCTSCGQETILPVLRDHAEIRRLPDRIAARDPMAVATSGLLGIAS